MQLAERYRGKRERERDSKAVAIRLTPAGFIITKNHCEYILCACESVGRCVRVHMLINTHFNHLIKQEN